MQTETAPSFIIPSFTAFMSPATDAAEPGSARIPSVEAINL